MAEVSKPQLGNEFEQKRAATYGDRVRDAAGQKQFTAFMDWNHSDPKIMKLCASEDTFKALKDAGVKHIVAEMILPEFKPVIDMYFQGKVGRASLKFFFDEVAPIINKNRMLSPQDRSEIYMSLVDNSKKYGIALQVGDYYEGYFTETESAALKNYLGYFSQMVVGTHNGNPQIAQMPKDQIEPFLGLIANHLRKKYPQVVENYDKILQDRSARLAALKNEILAKPEMRVNLGTELSERGFISKDYAERIQKGEINDKIADNLVDGAMLLKRMELDNVVAQRIKALVGDDKTAIIFGAGHFLRQKGDIDYYIGNEKITNIKIYSENKPVPNQEGISIQTPDYSLEIDSGTWTDNGKNMQTKIEMPPGFTTTPEALKTPIPSALKPGL